MRLKEWEEPGALTCQASGQPDGAGVGAGLGVRLQQVAEDGVGDEVEHVSRDVAQDHGAGAAVQALDALGLQDAADAVDGAAVQPLVSDADRAQRDVGAARHVPGQVQVLCGRGRSLLFETGFDVELRAKRAQTSAAVKS